MNTDNARSYATLSLIASYWYRIAYQNGADTLEEMTPQERVALHLAKAYDSRACVVLPAWGKSNKRAHQIYHRIYAFWRDNDFNEAIFASLTSGYRSSVSLPISG